MKTLLAYMVIFSPFIRLTECFLFLSLSEESFSSGEQFDVVQKTSEINNVEDCKALEKFYEEKEKICKSSVKKYDDLVKTIDNYVQRYVSLFLITSNLHDLEIKDPDEIISVDLTISITGEDLFYLQTYSKHIKESSYPKNFSKLDSILYKIAKLKEKRLAEDILKSSKSIFESFFNFSVITNSNFYQFLSVLLTLGLTWLIHYCLYHKSIYLFLGLTVNSLIFWESLNEYWKQLQEANLEIFPHTNNGVPEECNPANFRWYHNVWNYLTRNQCLEYQKVINKNPVTEVSLLKCCIDTYSLYLIRTPFKIYAATVRDLTEEISAMYPYIMRHFVNLPVALFFAVLLALFVIILCLRHLRLSFFGATLDVGGVESLTENQRTALNFREIPKSVRLIRKLKPLTKGRFPKRLEGNLRRQRKLFVKSCKHDFDSPSEGEQKCFSSNNEFNKTESEND